MPLLYRFVGTPGARVVAHAAIGAAAFAAVAVVVGRGLRHRGVRAAAVVALAGLGLTTRVTAYDGAVLADSVAISLSVALVAAWTWYADRPDRRSAAAVALVTLLWSATKDVHLYLGVVVLVVAALAAARARWARPWPALLLALAAISVGGLVADGRNTETADFNLAAVVSERVVPDDDLRGWFEDHGLPALDAKALGTGVGISDALADPRLGAWIRGPGAGTYRWFLVTHPAYVLREPLGDLLAGQVPLVDDPSTDRVMLSPSASYGSSRRVLPAALDHALFDPGRTGILLGGFLAAVAGWATARRRWGPDRRAAAPLLVLAVSVPHVLLLWHGTTFEHERHAMPLAVTVRVAVVALAAGAADRWSSLRRDPVAGGPEGSDDVGEHLVGPLGGDLAAIDHPALGEGPEQEREGEVEVEVAPDLAAQLRQLEHRADRPAALLEHRRHQPVQVVVPIAGGQQGGHQVG